MHRTDTRFGASMEKFLMKAHLTMVKLFRDTDLILRASTKQSLSSSSSKEGHRDESSLTNLSNTSAQDSFKTLRWRETKSMESKSANKLICPFS
uniref:Uncharacterized protein n=1 Tax=Arundo donax TaxID=35708 RepID=A0A0A9H7D6_ARUDO